MLAGRMAFGGANLKSVLTQQLTTDPPLIHITRPDVPPTIIDIVRRCLLKQPEERYQTAGEVAEALRGALGELPRLSTPVPQVATPAPGAERSGFLSGRASGSCPQRSSRCCCSA